MSDTTMLRVSTELRDKLKAKAKAEGRTLEWTANQALNEFLLPKSNTERDELQVMPPITINKPVPGIDYAAPKHYKPTDDWGA